MGPSAHTRRLVAAALVEDIGRGDITTEAIGVAGRRGRATLLGKSAGILCGGAVFAEVFRQLDRRCRIQWRIREGGVIRAGAVVAELAGDLAALLTGERTALNFLARLSGIATLTRRFVERIGGTRARVLDTRKTTPGWRELEKYAVRVGGGANHRMGLDDVMMVKNNHIAVCGGITSALRRVADARRRSRKRARTICEARTLPEARTAIGFGVDWVLLDHFGPARLRRVVAEMRRLQRKTGRRIVLESSGGVTLRNIPERAQTGVDFISVGALTQSASAVDFSLRLG